VVCALSCHPTTSPCFTAPYQGSVCVSPPHCSPLHATVQCTMLHLFKPHYASSPHTPHHPILLHIILYYTTPSYATLHHPILHDTILYYTTPSYTTPHHPILHCTTVNGKIIDFTANVTGDTMYEWEVNFCNNFTFNNKCVMWCSVVWCGVVWCGVV